jgi:hypothetical protein
MSRAQRLWIGLAGAGLIALVVWWLSGFTIVLQGERYTSAAASQDALLAAQRFLGRQGIRVLRAKSLGEALDVHHAAQVMFVMRRDTPTDAASTRMLLEWVTRGHVLVLSARPIEADEGLAPDERDQIDAVFDTRLSDVAAGKQSVVATLHWPGLDHPLHLQPMGTQLVYGRAAPIPLIRDTGDAQLRVYAWGMGSVVYLDGERWVNTRLQQADHGELLYTLVSYPPRAAPRPAGQAVHALLVDRFEAEPWYTLLARRFPLALVLLLLLTLLAAWRATVRLGPLRPAPPLARRALLEHVQAVGHWLWRSPEGRTALLASLRAAVRARLLRSQPALARLAPAAFADAIARQYGLPPDAVLDAFHANPGRNALAFARLVETLQRMRLAHDSGRPHSR